MIPTHLRSEWRSRLERIASSGHGVFVINWLKAKLTSAHDHLMRSLLVRHLAYLGRFEEARSAFAERRMHQRLNESDVAHYMVALAELRLLQIGDFTSAIKLTTRIVALSQTISLDARLLADVYLLRHRALEYEWESVSGDESVLLATRRECALSAASFFESIGEFDDRDTALRYAFKAQGDSGVALNALLRLASEAESAGRFESAALSWFAAAPLIKRDNQLMDQLFHKCELARSAMRSPWRRALLDIQSIYAQLARKVIGAHDDHIIGVLHSVVAQTRLRGYVLLANEGMRLLSRVLQLRACTDDARSAWLEAYRKSMHIRHNSAVAVLLMDWGVSSGPGVGYEFTASMLDAAHTLRLGRHFRQALASLIALNLSQRGRTKDAIEVCDQALRRATGRTRLELIRAIASPMAQEGRHRETCRWYVEGIEIADRLGLHPEASEFRRNLAIAQLQALRAETKSTITGHDCLEALRLLDSAVATTGQSGNLDLIESLGEAVFYAGYRSLAGLLFRTAAANAKPAEGGFLLYKLGLLELDRLQQNHVEAGAAAESLFDEAQTLFRKADLAHFSVDALLLGAHTIHLRLGLEDESARHDLMLRLNTAIDGVIDLIGRSVAHITDGRESEAVINAAASANRDAVKLKRLTRVALDRDLGRRAVSLIESFRGRAIARQLSRLLLKVESSQGPLLNEEEHLSNRIRKATTQGLFRALYIVEQQGVHGNPEAQAEVGGRLRIRRASPASPSDVVAITRDYEDSLFVIYWNDADHIWMLWFKGDADDAQIKRLPIRYEFIRATAEICSSWHGAGALDAALKGLEPLVAPIEKLCKPDTPVIFIPYGAIHNIPLHAIRCEGRYLIERNPIVCAPSLTCFHYLALLSKPWRYERGVTPTGAIFGDPSQHSKLRSLSESRTECEYLARMLSSPLKIGEGVTKSSVLNGLKDATLFHYAGHAQFVPHNPPTHLAWESFLEVSNGEKVTVQDMWASGEVACRLAVLSACQSGVVALQAGDETVSLSHALLAIGIPRVLTTLWPVLDRRAARFMGVFYKRLLEDNALSPAYAFQAAVRTMLAESESDEIMEVWAPFVISGVWW